MAKYKDIIEEEKYIIDEGVIYARDAIKDSIAGYPKAGYSKAGYLKFSDNTTTAAARHEGGTKYDEDKPFGGILYEYFPRALLEVARVSTFGAKKYARGGWKHVPNAIERYTDAMHRHLIADAKGEKVDPESGLSHKAHAAWGALCILELIIRGEQDDSN